MPELNGGFALFFFCSQSVNLAMWNIQQINIMICFIVYRFCCINCLLLGTKWRACCNSCVWCCVLHCSINVSWARCISSRTNHYLMPFFQHKFSRYIHFQCCCFTFFFSFLYRSVSLLFLATHLARTDIFAYENSFLHSWSRATVKFNKSSDFTEKLYFDNIRQLWSIFVSLNAKWFWIMKFSSWK